MTNADLILTTFSSLSRLDGSAWDAQCDALAARLDADRADAAHDADTRRHVLVTTVRAVPIQPWLPTLGARGHGRTCPVCGRPVREVGHRGPLPRYCSARCQRREAGRLWEAVRPGRARRRGCRCGEGQCALAV